VRAASARDRTVLGSVAATARKVATRARARTHTRALCDGEAVQPEARLVRLYFRAAVVLAALDDAQVSRLLRVCARSESGEATARARQQSGCVRPRDAPGHAQQIFLPDLPRTGAAGAAGAVDVAGADEDIVHRV